MSRQILKLSVDGSDLDFIKYIVNNLRVDVNGEVLSIYYWYKYIHTKTIGIDDGFVGHPFSAPRPPSIGTIFVVF